MAEANELHLKLKLIQQELVAPKDLKNDFAGYKYRSAESILASLKPLLAKNNLTLIFDDEIINIGEFNYIKTIVTISDGNDNLTSTAWAREEVAKKGMDSAQITGSTSSYARKYALNGLFAIDDTKDPDSQDNSNHISAKANSTRPATPKQKQYIMTLLGNIGVKDDLVVPYLEDQFGLIPGEEMTSADASNIIEHLS